MKILFVLEYYYPNVGGVEKLFKNLAESLAKAGHEILVITNKFDKNLPAEEKLNGVKIKRLNFKNRFLFTFLGFGSIFKYAKNYDLIHTTSYNAALPASIAGMLRKKKVIITFHEVWGKLWFKLPFMNFAQKVLFYSFERLILKLPYYQFIAVSESTKSDLIRHGIQPEKITRIYNGIENNLTKYVEPKHSEPFIFTFLGRLGVSKGLDLLIPAAEKFIKNYPASEFHLIAPDSPLSMFQKISNLIEKHKLHKGFSWHKNLNNDEIQKILLSSHCLVIPSYSEGFCFVAAEGVSMGIPIISSDKKALKEVVSGKFIKIKNLDIEGVYESLLKAKNGQYEETIPIKFTFERSIESYFELYKSLMEG